MPLLQIKFWLMLSFKLGNISFNPIARLSQAGLIIQPAESGSKRHIQTQHADKA